MAFEHWYCEFCKKESTVQHKRHAGVTEVKDMIVYQHRRKSPSCDAINGIAAVRVGFPPTVTGK